MGFFSREARPCPEFEQWAGIPAGTGSRMRSAGEYSDFLHRVKSNSAVVSHPLPVLGAGGLIIHENDNLRIVLIPQEPKQALIELQYKNDQTKASITWNGGMEDPSKEAQGICEGVTLSADRLTLDTPGAIVYFVVNPSWRI